MPPCENHSPKGTLLNFEDNYNTGLWLCQEFDAPGGSFPALSPQSTMRRLTIPLCHDPPDKARKSFRINSLDQV